LLAVLQIFGDFANLRGSDICPDINAVFPLEMADATEPELYSGMGDDTLVVLSWPDNGGAGDLPMRVVSAMHQAGVKFLLVCDEPYNTAMAETGELLLKELYRRFGSVPILETDLARAFQDHGLGPEAVEAAREAPVDMHRTHQNTSLWVRLANRPEDEPPD
jgi:hypothetical protein